MKIAERRHRVTFQKPRITRNEFGESITTYLDYFTTWCSFKHYTGKGQGREIYEANQINNEIMAEINLRYVKSYNLDSTMRAVFNGKNFEIVSVINYQERNKEIHLLVKEVV